jgi:hypothetical protein
MEPHAITDSDAGKIRDRQAIASFIAQTVYELALIAARARLPEIVHYLNAAQLEAQLIAGGAGLAKTGTTA